MAKILHLIGNFEEDSGGAQRAILDIVKTCVNSDVQMGICSFFGEATLSRQLPEKVYNVNLKYENKYNPKIIYDLYQLVRNWKPDILQVHSAVSGFLGRPVAKLFGIKLISTVQIDVRNISYRNRVLDKFTIGLSDSIVCVSDLVKQSVREEYGHLLSEAEIDVIPNCLNCSEFVKKVNTGALQKREELNLEKDDFIVGTVGRLHPQKGQKFLLEAWKGVVKRFPEVILIIAGGGKEENKLKKMAGDFGITASVHFLGARSDVPELLNIMDIFVFPSLWEGLPVALLEAMCMGKLIIASDIQNMSSTLGNSGILVPPAKSEQLRKALIQAIDNFDSKKILGDKASKRVRNKFSAEKLGRAYLNVYKELLQQ